MSTFTWGGRSWSPADLNAFKAWLAKHGSSYGRWAGNHPGAAAGTFGLTGSPDDALASARAEAAIAPERAAIQTERAAATKAGNDQLKTNAGLYEALANILKTQGPATQSAYEGAAGAIGGLAKGFSSDMAATQAADKSTLDDFLSKIGAPQGQVDQVNKQVGGTDAQDVAYGLGGYIPASSLAREGAAFTGAANLLPGQAAGLGLENARTITAGMKNTDKQYADQLLALAQKYPELRSGALNDILDARRAQEALDVQRQYLGLSQRKTGAELTGFDPVTGMPTPDTVAAARTTAGKTAKSKTDAAAKRESAFASARSSLFEDAKDYVKQTPVDPVDWVLAHPGRKLADAPKFETAPVDYVAAKKALFNKYKSLLRFSSQKYQYKLKRRLNSMIDEALAAQGIEPPKPKAKPQRRGATNTRTGFTPGVTDFPH